MKTEFSILKVKCESELIGKDILIPATEESIEIMRKFEYGDKMNCKIKYVGNHSLIRHDLFFSCVKLVSDNTGKPEYQVREQCKLDCRWIRGYTYYEDKDGNKRLNVITKSIAFSEMSLKEADEFYSQAFDVLAGYLGITTDEMTTEAKSRMQSKYIKEKPMKKPIDPNVAIREKILADYRYGKIEKDVACLEYYRFGGDANEIDPEWVDPEY